MYRSQANLIHRLENGDLDFVIVWGAYDYSSVQSTLCYQCEVGLLVPTASPLTQQDAITASAMTGKKIMTCARHFHPEFFDYFENFSRLHGFDLVVVPESEPTDNFSQARQMNVPSVACPEMGTPQWPIEGLRYVPGNGFSFRVDYELICDPFFMSPAASIFWSELRTQWGIYGAVH